jgi:hypothetical protein
MKQVNQPEWLRTIANGEVGGETWSIEMETDRFAVVRIPGRHYYSGLGRPQNYAGQQFELMRKDGKVRRMTIHEGRLTNLKRDLMLDMLDKSEEVGEIVVLTE